MADKRPVPAATLCAAVALFAPKAADSLMLVPCDSVTDHYVLADKEDVRRVEKGDTLWKISHDVYGTGTRSPEIAKRSGIANPDLIFPGQEIRIPRGDGYNFLIQERNQYGVCPITNRSGVEYRRVNHPRGTTIWDVRHARR